MLTTLGRPKGLQHPLVKQQGLIYRKILKSEKNRSLSHQIKGLLASPGLQAAMYRIVGVCLLKALHPKTLNHKTLNLKP